MKEKEKYNDIFLINKSEDCKLINIKINHGLFDRSTN